MFVNFSDIPGHENIYLDYLYEYDNVSRFFKANFRNKDEFLNIFKVVSEANITNRNNLADIIKSQYDNYTPSPKTINNIELLKSKKTLTVVTGQQLGMLGGPLYTFYKIITAIKLSTFLSERYDNFNFVPVFWLEGDDHDFNEIRHVNLINDKNDLQVFNYGNEVSEDEDRSSVGYIKIDDSINVFLDEIKQSIRNTEFTSGLFARLKTFYSPGKSLKDAFKELLFWLFDKYGLILFDPQDKNIKEIMKPIFRDELTNFRKHTETMVGVSAELEDLYHAQVKVRPVNLFYSTDGGRFLLDPVDNEFRLHKRRKRFSYDELMNLIETEPENFSPNVLLRPVCQDYVLPTAFYVGGPGEVAYFAQVLPLYDFFNVHSPVIYPRSSATILEKNIDSIIDKYNLSLNQAFWEPEALKKHVLASLSDITVDDIFGDATEKIDLVLDQLKEKLFEFDKTISDASAKYRQRIMSYLEELKGKAVDSQKKKYETTLRQVDKLSSTLLPNGSLQERELNFIYFVNKYGYEILDKIFEELAINKFEHQIISI
jgi:bacillithiol biosynthesis cysteine-adding enzyme BshC